MNPETPPCYVLSLHGSPRRARMGEMLKKLGIVYEWIDGVVVRSDEEVRKWLYFFDIPADAPASKMTFGTLGCKLAFMNLFRRLASETSAPLILILEDDIEPNLLVDFQTLRWQDLVQGHVTHLHLLPPQYRCGMQATLITRAALQFLAQNLFALWTLDYPIDIICWNTRAFGLPLVQAALSGPENWMFKQESDYIDVSQSERLRLNMELNSTYEDYKGLAKTFISQVAESTS